MKVRSILLIVLVAMGMSSFAQHSYNELSGQTVNPNVITTAVPFVSISPDARGGALGDCGVASEPDGSKSFKTCLWLQGRINDTCHYKMSICF